MEWNKILESGMSLLTTWGLRIAGVLVALSLAWILAGWARRSLLGVLEKRKIDPTLGRFFSNLLKYTIIVTTGLGCLGVFGIETTSFAALLASVGLAMGLAFQGTLSNFAAGVMLLVFRPFHVGDVISTVGRVGTVKEIDLFTSEITSFDNKRIIIPNSAIFGAVIENLTSHDTRRVDVSVGVAYGADIDRTREVLEAMTKDISGVIEDPAPEVFLEKLGPSSVDWIIRVWTRTELYWDVHQATVRQAKKALDAASLAIPFPQMDVHVTSGPPALLARR